jgi:hypothetical protein
VLSATDPTAQAEMTAIRDTGAKARNFDLSGAEIYMNAMPCPMYVRDFLGADREGLLWLRGGGCRGDRLR